MGLPKLSYSRGAGRFPVHLALDDSIKSSLNEAVLEPLGVGGLGGWRAVKQFFLSRTERVCVGIVLVRTLAEANLKN